jgi:hypothetical protein
MDWIILALLPTILLAVAAVVLIEHLRVKEGGERYQHREHRPEDPGKGKGNGNGSSSSGNGHAPPGRRGKR